MHSGRDCFGCTRLQGFQIISLLSALPWRSGTFDVADLLGLELVVLLQVVSVLLELGMLMLQEIQGLAELLVLCGHVLWQKARTGCEITTLNLMQKPFGDLSLWAVCRSENMGSLGPWHCSHRGLMYLQLALQGVEVALELVVCLGHLGPLGFEHRVVLLPEGKVLPCHCQASLGEADMSPASGH